MNKVELTGRLARDPEIRYTNGGSSVASFTVAVDRRFKRDGEQSADFIPCTAFGKTGEFVEKYFTKGSGIELSGRIQTGSYTNRDGKKVYTTDVIVEEVGFTQGGKAGNPEGNSHAKADGDDFMQIPDSIDDEVPFA